MKIIVGVDGSEHSLAALRFACRMLDAERDSVVLYYSVPTKALEVRRPHSEEFYATARDAFSQAVFDGAKRAVPSGLNERTHVVLDNQKPGPGILSTATAEGAEMIVVGARGAGPIGRLLLGSVSRTVAQACQLPTLVVRNTKDAPADAPLRALVGCSGTQCGAQFASVLGKLTWPRGSKATVLHVIESLLAGDVPAWLIEQARSTETELQAQAWVLEHEQDKLKAEQQMRDVCRQMPPGLQPCDVSVVEGHPAEKLLTTLEQEPFDLAVIGAHAHGALVRLLLGSTSEHVLSQSPTSVLLVPDHNQS